MLKSLRGQWRVWLCPPNLFGELELQNKCYIWRPQILVVRNLKWASIASNCPHHAIYFCFVLCCCFVLTTWRVTPPAATVALLFRNVPKEILTWAIRLPGIIVCRNVPNGHLPITTQIFLSFFLYLFIYLFICLFIIYLSIYSFVNTYSFFFFPLSFCFLSFFSFLCSFFLYISFSFFIFLSSFPFLSFFLSLSLIFPFFFILSLSLSFSIFLSIPPLKWQYLWRFIHLPNHTILMLIILTNECTHAEAVHNQTSWIWPRPHFVGFHIRNKASCWFQIPVLARSFAVYPVNMRTVLLCFVLLLVIWSVSWRTCVIYYPYYLEVRLCRWGLSYRCPCASEVTV